MKKASIEQFEQLITQEPRLEVLEADIRRVVQEHKGKKKFCANSWWYGFLAHPRKAGEPEFTIKTFDQVMNEPDPPRAYSLLKGADGYGFKQELSCLVGWAAVNESLRSSAAYDIAYDYLYHLLDNCRGGCACF